MHNIISDIRGGDRQAFKELFEDYYPILCVFTLKYIKDEEQCKDIAQEVLLSYWQNRENFEDIYKVKGYLYTVARNRCLNVIKHEHVDLAYTQGVQGSEPDVFFDDHIIRQETYMLVRKAVHALPSQMRKIIEYSMQGLKNSEIAAELAIAEGTVHALKKSAYKKLREQLQEHFYLLLF